MKPYSRPEPVRQVPDISKDLEIISAKLDAIKSSIETLNHRVSAIERNEKRW